MRYCTRCVYPENHPLHLTFDEQGVCSGCRVHEEKDRLDWRARGGKLRGLLDAFKSRSGASYDCIVPVSGARDSYFIVHSVKRVYGMNPLLVSYNKHYNTPRGIRNFAYLRTLFDCDAMTKMVAEDTVKRLTRHTLRRLGSMYWHCLAGETVFPVQVAVRLKIPLIVWGVHQGCDQVGMFSHLDEVEMTRKYRKDHDLMGVEAEDLVGGVDGVREEDVQAYVYPHDKEIEKVGVRGIYLSNYIRWDSKRQHEQMIDLYGYEPAAQQRTFDTYNDVDSHHYSGIHDYIKYLKWGFGKVSDHATRELRLRRLTRKEAIGVVGRYQDVVPTELPLLLSWLEMDEREFWECIDARRDPRAWERRGGDWRLRDSVLNHARDPGVEQVRLGTLEPCAFRLTPGREPRAVEDRYVLFGKGHVDEARP